MSQAPARTFKLDEWSLSVYPASRGDRLIPVDALGGTTQPVHGVLLLAQAEEHALPHALPAEAAAAPGHAGPAAAPAAEHGAAGAEHAVDAAPGYQMPYEIPNLAMIIQGVVDKEFTGHHGRRPHPSEAWFINPLFTIVIALGFVALVRRAFKRPSLEKPGRLQNAMEGLLGALRHFFGEVLGPGGEKFLPFVLALFLFIWINNLAGLIPLFKAPTSSFKTTVALALITFCYVHFNAIREGGFKAWFMHLMGEPLWLAPLNFPLHVMGELIKPVSLSLRLFGNIFGEDKLLAAFLGMGMLIVAALFHVTSPLVGVPLHTPFFFLALLTCTIQAAVFALLASVYIVLLLPHEHEGDHDEAAHGVAQPESPSAQ